ncbi:MAG: hypothetical protein ACKV2Q_22655 [Planctomycetaceae bacterium]
MPIPYRDMPWHHPEEDPNESAAIPPLKYQWHRECGGQQERVRIVCHVSDNACGGLCVRFYVGDQDKWQPAHEFFQPSCGSFEFCDLIHVQSGPVANRDELLRYPMFFLRHNSGGSASCWDYELVSLLPSAQQKLFVISIEPPTVALKSLLKPTLHSESARTWIAFEKGSFRFSFALWNEGEHNNFPTGGTINGTMKLVMNDDGEPSRLVVDQWERSSTE